MRTPISPQNPYSAGRHAFAWENVPAGASSHLDFGCNDGRFLNSLKTKGITHLVGLDRSSLAIALGRAQYPDLELAHVDQTVPLNLPDRTFDSITVMDVIEHVYEQRELLLEFNRVLKDDGRLIITVPRQYMLSFLDMGNFKFRFPLAYKCYYCLRHSRQQYHSQYLENPDGLLGDVSARKGWHEHFSAGKLEMLLRSGNFSAVHFDGSGLFTRPIRVLSVGWGSLPLIRNVIESLVAADSAAFESMNLFCVARKIRQ
jgi:SAM-dependent methyltransferase